MSAAPPPQLRAGPGPVQKIVGFLFRAVVHNWKLFPLTFAVGAGIAFGGSYLLGKQTWESAGVMIYAPAPMLESQKSLYIQPDLQTLVSLVKSPGVLNGLRDDLDLPVPTQLLEKIITVTAPRTVQTVTVSVKWAEPEMAANIINRLMDRFIDQIRNHRKRRAGESLIDYEARLTDCDARYKKATDAHQNFFRTHNLVDARAEIDAMRQELGSLLRARSDGMRTEVSLFAQQERMNKELESTRKQVLDDAEKEKSFDAARESVSDARRRQDRLKELIDEEKKRQELMADLSVKRKEYQRVAELRAQGAESQTRVDELSRDMEVITSKLNDNDKVKLWKAELENIDKAVLPKGSNTPTGSPIIQQILFRQLEIDLHIIGLQKEMFATDKAVIECRRRQEELQLLLNESDGVQKQMDALAAERQHLAEQLELFRRLRDQKAGEFVIVSPATPGPYPAGSSRKMYLMAGLAISGLCGLLRMCRREWIDGYHGGRELAARAGLTITATLDDGVESERRAATDLRRWVPQFGAVMVLCDGGNGHPDASVKRLATRFAGRDERVLIIDARIGRVTADAASAGLADLLDMRESNWESLLRTGPAPGIDYLPAGRASDPDALASQLMRELLAAVIRRYSLVLMLGPNPEDANSLDALLPYAGGVLICFGKSRPRTSLATVMTLIKERCTSRIGALLCDGLHANDDLPMSDTDMQSTASNSRRPLEQLVVAPTPQLRS